MKKVKYNEEDVLDHHGVVAVIKNKKKEILMQKHLKYEFWTLPVGKVKHNQTVEQGLKQEVLEECNITIKESKEIARREYNYLRNNKKVKVDVHLFDILKYEGEMKNNEPQKHETQEFLSLEKIKKLPYLSDVTLLYLETLGYKRKPKI